MNNNNKKKPVVITLFLKFLFLIVCSKDQDRENDA
jgi:hypothetical protein